MITPKEYNEKKTEIIKMTEVMIKMGGDAVLKKILQRIINNKINEIVGLTNED
tara:strand:- start:303 stop:461 length:159 start_codon:yes stop_codon:yes gene_type:complete